MPLDLDAVVMADSLEVQSVGAACQTGQPWLAGAVYILPTAIRAFCPRFSLHTSQSLIFTFVPWFRVPEAQSDSSA